ncbi:hypothetical protein QR680_003859 [Steinernema hermaphroditum]|uniref:Uncharacterized protein n=1 Tax=Steinernema hermaphroditum TaxID=289476 RepID=A0AA39LT21_9BILA|nr:hypothetical protein QR680_003859 [Steinernema hermaphroditum]
MSVSALTKGRFLEDLYEESYTAPQAVFQEVENEATLMNTQEAPNETNEESGHQENDARDPPYPYNITKLDVILKFCKMLLLFLKLSSLYNLCWILTVYKEYGTGWTLLIILRNIATIDNARKTELGIHQGNDRIFEGIGKFLKRNIVIATCLMFLTILMHVFAPDTALHVFSKLSFINALETANSTDFDKRILLLGIAAHFMIDMFHSLFVYVIMEETEKQMRSTELLPREIIESVGFFRNLRSNII